MSKRVYERVRKRQTPWWDHLHKHWAFLTPDTLGSVIRLHVCGHPVLHGARDVLLDDVGAVISVEETKRVDTVI